MPWTENFWHFDNFPYGGEDFELSVFLIVAMLSLVLVLMQHGKKGVVLLFALARWLSSALQDAGSLATDGFGDLTKVPHAPPLPSPAFGKYSFPIRI
jgi:hypothetical protein